MKKITIIIVAFIVIFTLQACNSNKTANEFEFINNFNNLLIGDGFEDETALKLNSEQQSKFKKLLQTEKWEVGTDLPERGSSSPFVIMNDNYDVMYIDVYYEKDNTALIMIKYKNTPNEAISYTAPLEIIADLENLIATLIKE